MKKVIISPFSRALRNGKINPKNYPSWPDVVTSLNALDVHTIQIGERGEPPLPVTESRVGSSFAEVRELVRTCDTWVSVDNFMGHLGSYLKKKGVVIFGKSDPLLFGYPTNVNLLKARGYLRPDQWRWWEDVSYSPEVFVPPAVVVTAVMKILSV